jgi:ABC-type glutathione transport system ATPase component
MKNKKMGAISMSDMLLQIRNATKIYTQRQFGGEKRQVVALDRFNLDIPHRPATITTIAGESGSGKTTWPMWSSDLLRFRLDKSYSKG